MKERKPVTVRQSAPLLWTRLAHCTCSVLHSSNEQHDCYAASRSNGSQKSNVFVNGYVKDINERNSLSISLLLPHSHAQFSLYLSLRLNALIREETDIAPTKFSSPLYVFPSCHVPSNGKANYQHSDKMQPMFDTEWTLISLL